MAQQTALTWFWEQLPELLPFTVDTETAVGLLMAYEEAKAMEKEQIIKAHGMKYYDLTEEVITGKQYYNETYQSNKD
jgi:hypothetical protein